MTRLKRLLRTLTEREQLDALRFRPKVEVLEQREVPAGLPGIGLAKSVDFACYSPGAMATSHYVVTNTGDVALTAVKLTDDNGTPERTNDDFNATPGDNSNPLTAVAAVDDNGTPLNSADDFAVQQGALLLPGHSWSFTQNCTVPNTITTDTTITNVATVTASPANNAPPVFASDSATINVCVPTTPPTPLAHGDTATIGFWNNKNGQALVNSVNSGPGATQLATWLATTFPNLYGANAGANNLTGKTNADVASLFQKDFAVKGAKTDAQVLAGALAVYVTDFDLAGGAAVKYGFTVTTTNTAEKTINVGSLGTAIGLQNNTDYTVLQLLHQADTDKANGIFNAGAFNSIFDGINQTGDIK